MASLFGSRQNRSNPPGNVRVIAKIRDITNRERNSGNHSLKQWISVRKSQDASESVTLSFGDQSASQKESCQVHSCYGPEEGNDIIFTKEIMPLISRVFDGHSSSVVAYGAIGSGKTYTIQGSEEKPGLAILAMDEIISEAERLGKLVAISFYEIHQEQAYDLLSPERPAISVLEDARGRIQLKGLSRVPIKSTLEFRKIYLAGHSSRKSVQKTPTEPPRRSHKGLIILVTTPDDNSEASVGGKMNFLDFAGYEDPRRKSGDSSRILENNKLNKSLFTLQKVILALNANESRVPFRESKVTRMLQDSLGGINKLTIVACLNPFFCQDSIYMANLACRTYEGISQCIIDSTKKGKGSNKRVSVSSCKSGVTRSTSTSVKQQTNSSVHFLQKKVSGAASAVKGKKLFDEASQCKKSVEATLISSVASTVDPSMLEEESSTYTVASSKVASAKKEKEYCSVATKETSLEGEPSPLQEKSCSDATKEPLSEGEISPLSVVTETEHTSNDASHKRDEAIHFVHNPMYSHCELFSNINCNAEASSFTTEGENVDKENSNLPINSGISPPISSRLKELSNSLKLLHSTPIPNKLRQEANLSSDDVVLGEHADIEPKTPIFRSATTLNERQYVDTPQEVSKTCYPGTKNSLVQEYLRFINSASKEELKGLKGIGEKRATYILELREESPEPFKNLDDLKDIGLSEKQIKRMLALK